MKYMLLSYLDEKAWAALGETEQQRIMEEATPHVQQLIASGRFLGGAPLHPTATATTVSVRDGKRLVADGPFAETREQLGGYALIEAQDLDEAIRIASGFLGRCPSTIEIRPVMEAVGVPTHVGDAETEGVSTRLSNGGEKMSAAVDVAVPASM